MIDWKMHDVLMLFWQLLSDHEDQLMCGDFIAINDDLRLIYLAKAWVLHTLKEAEEESE